MHRAWTGHHVVDGFADCGVHLIQAKKEGLESYQLWKVDDDVRRPRKKRSIDPCEVAIPAPEFEGDMCSPSQVGKGLEHTDRVVQVAEAVARAGVGRALEVRLPHP